LRSGSLSNLWVRSRIRTAGSCYPPGGRVAPTGMSPAATATNPLLSMALLPSRRTPRPTGEVVPWNLRSVAMRPASYTAWVFRSTSPQEKPRKTRDISSLVSAIEQIGSDILRGYGVGQRSSVSNRHEKNSNR
jgi:hypothetical protein